MVNSVKRYPFKVRLLSPCYIGGADERGSLETLRIPSLRGALRFWFRTKEPFAESKELYRQEALVFGSAELGQGLRILPVDVSHPYSSDHGRRTAKQRYLGYGAASENHRKALPPGAIYSFVALGSSHQIAELERSLILLHLFGGLGARSRRGWGAAEVLVGVGDSPIISGQDESEVNSWIGQALRRVWPDSKQTPKVCRSEPPRSAFTSSSRSAVIGPYDGWASILNEFRDRFDRIKSAVRVADPGKAPLRIGLGLPWAYGRPPRSYEGRVGNEEDVQRRASPLHLSICRIQEGYFGTMLYLGGKFFGRDTALWEVSAGAERPIGLPDTSRAAQLYLDATNSTTAPPQYSVQLP